jgi:multidrug efflux pump subunit AcrA (membrane-fusion protein)
MKQQREARADPERWWIWVLAAAIAGAGYATLARSNRGPEPIEVEVGTVTRRAQFQSSVSASGEIVASRYAEVGSSGR